MILVAGATGVLGSEIVRRLLERGRKARALVRESSSPDKVRALGEAGAEIVRGDLKDPGSLERACRGVSAVISTVTMITTGHQADSFDATDGGGTKNLIDAAKANGIGHFVFVSFDTTKSPEAPLPAAKREVEEHLKKTGLPYTILHPSLFMESWLGPMLFGDPATATAKVYGNGTEKIRYVAVADVAEIAVQCLDNPRARNATIPVGGPVEITQREAVKIFEEEFGKPFTVTEISAEALEAQWRTATDPMEKTFASLMLGVARGFDSGIASSSDSFTLQMTSPRDFVSRMAKGGS